MKPLSGIDAAFLALETPETPMHVGALHLYDVPARARGTFFERARRHVESRLHLAPVFTRRLATLPLDMASPVWVEDRPVDLDYHVRRVVLPKPGTMAQLEATVARLHTALLDRSRPLWVFTVIEGLASGQVAWYTKIHHAALDGAAGVQLAGALMDTTARPRRVAVPKSRRLEVTPGVGSLLGAALSKSAAGYAKMVRQLPELARVLGKTLDPRTLLAEGGKGGGRGAPIGPATPFNVPITPARAYATATIPLSEVKAIAARHGATVNDVVLALVSGALRRCLKSQKALPSRPLVAAMPVSLRAEGDSAYSTRATLVLANLATNVADPVARLGAIRASAGRAKAITVHAKSVIPVDFPSLGAPWVLAAAAKVYGYLQGVKAFPPLANLVISNVPGPQAPLYLAGCRMTAWWPCSIVTHGLGLNVTAHSYDGALYFGVVAAKAAMPDVRHLAGALYDALEELKKRAA